MILLSTFAAFTFVCLLIFYKYVIEPSFNPLRRIAGPPVRQWFGNHMAGILDPIISRKVHAIYVKRYGRCVRVRGLGPWDERLLALDPLSIAHVMKNSTIYEKPWQSRVIITGLIGCGILSAEGEVHKRQRRVAQPGFSSQNMRALVPVVFGKGTELKDRWLRIISDYSGDKNEEGVKIDVCSWISRATFDVIGLAGFDYSFNAIENESNELFVAYKKMFDVSLAQGQTARTIIDIYVPFLNKIFPSQTYKTVQECHKVIHQVAGKLIQEKKRKVAEGGKNGEEYAGKDILSLLLKANASTDLAPDQRLTDEDVLNNINTTIFAGSDTSSLAMTWTLLLLARNPEIQDRLRNELLSAAPAAVTQSLSNLTPDEIQSLYGTIGELPYLNNVVRESLRLIPPVHSSLRVATQDDEIPAMYPIHNADGSIAEGKKSISIAKGSFVHVPIEAFNLDKAVWGEDAWEFNPDRWDDLPELAMQSPGLFSHMLSFSAGPRACIGLRFSLIEMKTFLYILIANLTFAETKDKVIQSNVVLTRPYVAGKVSEGSQCPLFVKPYPVL